MAIHQFTYLSEIYTVVGGGDSRGKRNNFFHLQFLSSLLILENTIFSSSMTQLPSLAPVGNFIEIELS